MYIYLPGKFLYRLIQHSANLVPTGVAAVTPTERDAIFNSFLDKVCQGLEESEAAQLRNELAYEYRQDQKGRSNDRVLSAFYASIRGFAKDTKESVLDNDGEVSAAFLLHCKERENDLGKPLVRGLFTFVEGMNANAPNLAHSVSQESHDEDDNASKCALCSLSICFRKACCLFHLPSVLLLCC